MKTLHETYFEKAATLAICSNCTHQHGAVIVDRRNNAIVSQGWNYKCSSLSHAFSIHAEIDAIQKIRRLPKKTIQSLDLYVVRIGEGYLKYSQPCNNCMKLIRQVGIKRIYFSSP